MYLFRATVNPGAPCAEIGTLGHVARTAKPLAPLDFAVVGVLTRRQRMCGISQRRLAEASGMSLNRVGIVLRGETPPASVGEVGALSAALGLTVAEVLREAETTERGGGDRVSRE